MGLKGVPLPLHSVSTLSCCGTISPRRDANDTGRNDEEHGASWVSNSEGSCSTVSALTWESRDGWLSKHGVLSWEHGSSAPNSSLLGRGSSCTGGTGSSAVSIVARQRLRYSLAPKGHRAGSCACAGDPPAA